MVMNLGDKKTDLKAIAVKMMKTAVSIDESLLKILKAEIKRLNQMAKGKIDAEELQRINTLIKNIVIALSFAEEKIKTGMEIYSGEAARKRKPQK